MADDSPKHPPGAGHPVPEWLPRLAHDLRNPVTPMRSAVQLLQLGQLPPEVAPDLLRTLDRQIDQLLRLIDDVSDLVRMEQGGFAVQLSTCELGAIVSAAVGRHARVVRSGGKAAPPVAVEASPEPLRVRADEVRLRQLVETLLGCLGGAPAASPASVQVASEGTDAVVRVRDGGRVLGGNECLAFLATGEAPAEPSALSMGTLVARRIVELHGARVGFVDDALELRLPLAEG